jgi:hypothetical protein
MRETGEENVLVLFRQQFAQMMSIAQGVQHTFYRGRLS